MISNSHRSQGGSPVCCKINYSYEGEDEEAKEEKEKERERERERERKREPTICNPFS